jgi:hypothetical protein
MRERIDHRGRRGLRARAASREAGAGRYRHAGGKPDSPASAVYDVIAH